MGNQYFENNNYKFGANRWVRPAPPNWSGLRGLHDPGGVVWLDALQDRCAPYCRGPARAGISALREKLLHQCQGAEPERHGHRGPICALLHHQAQDPRLGAA